MCLMTSGTRGDVQPLVALARELQRRGHDVVLGVPPNLLALARSAGLEAATAGPDTQAFMESPQGQAWLAAGKVRDFTSALVEFSAKHIEQSCTELVDVSKGADLVVSGILWEDLVLPLAEHLRVPLVTLHSAPFRPTTAVPAPLVTTRSLPGPLNRATHGLFDRVWRKGVRPQAALLRARLGLPAPGPSTAKALGALGVTELQAYSPTLVPGVEKDYGAQRPLVGFLTPDAELRRLLGEPGVSAELEACLGEGEPPVYIGFGSMPVTDPAGALAMVARATQSLGLRALVSAGWGRLGESGNAAAHVRTVGALDHDAVLPRCAAAVHHGGAGTTAAAVGAGLPSVVCSVFADQPFWGTRLERLGAGTHMPFSDLDEQRLTAALRTALAPAVRSRAAELGQQLRAEPPAAARAADLVEAAR